jgi:hypothetical protein
MEEATLMVAKVSARHCKVFPWDGVMVGAVLVLFPDRPLDSTRSSNIAFAMCVESGAMPDNCLYLTSSDVSERIKRLDVMGICSFLVTPTYRDCTLETPPSDIADPQ